MSPTRYDCCDTTRGRRLVASRAGRGEVTRRRSRIWLRVPLMVLERTLGPFYRNNIILDLIHYFRGGLICGRRGQFQHVYADFGRIGHNFAWTVQHAILPQAAMEIIDCAVGTESDATELTDYFKTV